jgi:gliding motility-associated-like protein
MSPQQLVQNVLLGQGVEISNVTFTGSNQAIGFFNAAGTNLGINEGIVITTGTVTGANGPQGPNNKDGAGMNNNFGGSNLLTNLVGGTETFNAAILEFDFKAVGDFVSFNYIFGSEEYLEFVNNGFNDVFALFISGPGIAGNQNIARLPNNQVVSIDNVNNVSNSFYYVDNGDGMTSPFNTNVQYIQYDGYTKVLKAETNVQCGKTYHLTIAIADVGDPIYDSGIFLEAQSLTSNEPYTSTFSLSELHFGASNIAAEGCTSASVTVTRTDTNGSVSIPIITQGTATEGLDYSNVPDQITFNPGQETFTFNFDILGDNLNEPTEIIEILIMKLNECLELDPDTIRIQIQNINPVNVVLPPDSLNCGPGEIITLQPIVTGGLQPYTYLWNTNETSPTINISPPNTQTFTVTVTDACLNSTDTDNASIFVANIPPLVIAPISLTEVLCPNTPEFFTAVASGGSGGYTYSWRNGSNVIGTSDTITLRPLQTTTFIVVATDLCGLQTSLNVNFIVETPLLIPAINLPPPICPGELTTLSASATLGLGAYSYVWDHSQETSPVVDVYPLKTTEYTVRISDECESYFIPIKVKVTVFEPFANFSFSRSNLNIGAEIAFFDASRNAVEYFWDLGNGETSEEKNPTTNYTNVGTFYVTLIIVDELGCRDTVVKPIDIGHLLFIPNTFTPDGNRFNNEFFGFSVNVTVRSFEIFNRWGEMVYFSENDNNFSWDGSHNGFACQDGTYTYRIRYTNPSQEEFVFVGFVNLLR